MAPVPFASSRVMYFTGKDGVGKASLACATAVALAAWRAAERGAGALGDY